MYLIIETATSRGLVALCEGDRVIQAKEIVLGLANSRLLEPAIAELIQGQKLDFIACGQGPGSYTGIRVGAASAKALALGFDIPLVAVGSLHGFVPECTGPYLAAIDAKIGGIYTQQAVSTEEGIVFKGEERLISVEAFVEELKASPCVATPSWAPIAKRLPEGVSPKVFETGPSAKQLAKEAIEKFNSKKYALDGSIELLYLRATQAEIARISHKLSGNLDNLSQHLRPQ